MGIFDKLKNLANGKGNKVKKVRSVKSIDKEESNETNAYTDDTTKIQNESPEKLSLSIENESKRTALDNDEVIDKDIEGAENIVELEEMSRRQIVKTLSSLSYADAKLKKLVFHFKESRGSVASVQGELLFKEPNFLNRLKASLEDKNIQFVDNVNVELIFSSNELDNFTKITNQVSVQVITPKDIVVHKKARITVLNGKTIEPEYVIESRKKPYLIGRGENPKLPSARVIKNDIAFVEPKDGDDENIQLNRYVSRSILLIRFNEDKNMFEVGRTAYMFDSKNNVKINRLTGEGGQEEIKLNTTKINIPLKDDDQIIINNKINILFELVD